jgi:histidinol-phosphatase (PHP family)
VIDYHLHLWKHGSAATEPKLADLAAYVASAASRGVRQVAITEHLFRFRQADFLRGWWEGADPLLAGEASSYWEAHQGADLDRYVEVCLKAKERGLPVLVGLEVDYYTGRMAEVDRLLRGYPLDLVVGSVHWLGAWMFDNVDSAPSMAEWARHDPAEVWDAYIQAVGDLVASGVADVVGHPDLVKVTGDAGPASEDQLEALASILAANHVVAEVSSAGWRKPVAEQYPSWRLLQLLADREVPVVLASDSHGPELAGDRNVDLVRMVRQAGYRQCATFEGRIRGASFLPEVAM